MAQAISHHNLLTQNCRLAPLSPTLHGLLCVHFGKRHVHHEEWVYNYSCQSNDLNLSKRRASRLGRDKQTPHPQSLPTLTSAGTSLGVHSNKILTQLRCCVSAFQFFVGVGMRIEEYKLNL